MPVFIGPLHQQTTWLPNHSNANQSMMSASERQKYLYRTLCTGQADTNKVKYLDPLGLFVYEEKGSEVEVIVSNNDIDYDSEEIQNSPTSSTTLTEPLTNLIYADRDGYDIPGYHRRILKGDSEISLVCNEAHHNFRMIHIKHIEHSRSRLHITRPCFEYMVHSMGIFPAIKDVILHMGNRNAEVEIAPPSLRAGYLFDKLTTANVPCGHEISYGLRYIQRNEKSSGKSWKLRQFFVYNKSLPRKESSQWLMFCLPEAIRTQVDDYLAVAQHETISQPFDIHTLLCSAVIRMWRPYFADLSEQVEKHRRQIETTDLADEDSVQAIGTSKLGVLKTIELDVLDALLAIRATKDTLQRIESVLSDTRNVWKFDNDINNKHELDVISSTFSDEFKNLDMLIEQAISLSQKVQGLSVLHASFLNLVNGFSLRKLAEQQEEESKEMRVLTKIASHDTKAVKALSIITLIYLPITVVFNFFSTSFVDSEDGGVRLVGRWWLLFAIGLPLTVLTLFVWITYVLRSRKNGDTKPASRDVEMSGEESDEEHHVETCPEKGDLER